MKTYSIIMLLSCLFCIQLSGQNIEQDIVRIQANYKIARGMQANMIYSLFPSSTAQHAVESHTGFFSFEGLKSYQQMNGIEQMINQQYTVIVNHENRMLLLQPAPEREELIKPAIDLDSILNLCDSMQFQSLDARLSAYSFYFSEGEYRQVQVCFDKKDFLIRKLVWFPAEPMIYGEDGESGLVRMEIRYDQLEINPSFKGDLFDTNRFVQKGEKGWQGTGAFSDYQVHCLLVD